MKAVEIKELTDKEILDRMEGEIARLSNLKMNHAISPLDNPMQIRATRRIIARFATELRQRELKK